VRKVMLRREDQLFMPGDGAGDLVAFPAERQYCNRLFPPQNLGTGQIRYLLRLRHNTGHGSPLCSKHT
jgi:hypothetical protein